MSHSTSTTWSIRLDEDLKNELKDIIKAQDFDNIEEFMQSMLTSFKLHKLKEIDESFASGIAELEHHLNCIKFLYSSSIEQQKVYKGLGAEYKNQIFEEMQQLKKDNNELSVQNTKLEHSLNMKNAELAVLQETLTQLQQFITTQNKLMADVSSQLNTSQENIQLLNRENHQLKERLASAEEGLTRYRNQGSLAQMNWNIEGTP